MKELIRAARMAPMTGGPLAENWALVHDGETILEAGPYALLKKGFSGSERDMGDVTLAPGLLNAHTHLEMSHLRGKVVSGLGFTGWIRSLTSLPMYALEDGDVKSALREMREAGVCFTADISTNNANRVAGLLDESGFFFVSFAEAIFFDPPAPNAAMIPKGEFRRGVFAAAGHAVYSTHPETLKLAKARDAERNLPFSLHLAENVEEVEMMSRKDGEFPDLLRGAGISLDAFDPPGTSPVEYAHSLGLLDRGTLAVHCTKVSDRDIGILADSNTNVCLCPRSNHYIGEGNAPWEKLFSAGLNICLGTDGLCSNRDLNLWNEAAFIKERFKGNLELLDLLATMTLNPARAMKVDGLLGSLEPGKAARFSVVPRNFEEMFQ